MTAPAFPPLAEREAHVPLCLTRQEARDLSAALQREAFRLRQDDPALDRIAAVKARLDRARAALRPAPPRAAARHRSKTR